MELFPSFHSRLVNISDSAAAPFKPRQHGGSSCMLVSAMQRIEGHVAFHLFLARSNQRAARPFLLLFSLKALS